MKVIMTCGGTGGHIYPAIAIADKIKEENPHAQIIFVGTGRPLERKAIPAAGYELRTISASGFHRRKIYRNFVTGKDMVKGMIQVGRIIKDFNPLAVIGTGGYVCVPVIMRAHQMGIKTYIHEQNAKPGLANRFLASRVDKVFLGFKEAAPYFKNQEKIIVTGNPIRKSFEGSSKVEARKQLSLMEDTFMLVIFGGSLGASIINEATVEALPILSTQKNIFIYFVTGGRYYDLIERRLDEKGLGDKSNIKLMEYAENMDILLAGADLVVSRAGALTLAEETLVGTPAILIPSPNVTGNHQFYNALAVSENGGAIILKEDEGLGSKLVQTILDLMGDPQRLDNMGTAMKKLGSKEGAKFIYEHLDLRSDAPKSEKYFG
ncbi:MAG: undecaprenyldiphospho-muramoylpentapeptide beta-N-acetylglucosaminyltransferase [Anaerovoracaceae bacterium]|jgi:UDP-N-acetylglucosamine--N-acetylmuramyl-(pentapeptide) pyrophosphoryl-undecaprenol N-acetylglucosamine transferase|nr:undecaprenyldiphospho-muramoylpentapeptide beta-N-acetylglucosaminyltransferase [Anaerovoracaceae bacterium]